MLQVLYHPKAEKELLAMPKKFRLRVIESIENLFPLDHPLQHRDVIKLQGRTADFRLRCGDYRVKFTFEKPRTVYVTHVEHRQAGY
jgi:mRNA-degrading endonuclease RelE of RelBE toxin-antitoxin system